ncbi:MAG: UDP-2,3-diacylglucosamine diphosphatase [Rikenellaceae bacterium]|nr:UDP-2,3-diacylglucosamine diphosphatase [Rikenellaceae bacterium]
MYYFASDVHLGLEYGTETPADRERFFIRWLDEVAPDAEAIFLVGDIFDFWFEYKRVVPKGHTRLLGKFSELTDRGVRIHFFTGNHDKWAREYLATECGVTMHHGPATLDLYGKRVFIAHGDTEGKRGGILTRLMQYAFHARWVRRAFSALVHPNQAIRFGHWWSGQSRKRKSVRHGFRGMDEQQVGFALKYLAAGHDIDYFVFGHIHCAEELALTDRSRIIFLGEWIERPTYAVMDPQTRRIALRAYPK